MTKQASLGEGTTARLGEQVAETVTHTTPLLQPPPVDTSEDEHISEPSSTGTARTVLIAFCVGTLLFLQGSNISALTTIQSTVATELNALSKSSWLTSAYVIAMSSTSPLLGRLCKIFTPRRCISVASLIFALGNVVTGLAPDFAGFLAGRAISGTGGAGIVACATILVIDMAPEKRRGLFLGLNNTGFTIGVSLGAVVAGALLPSFGWRAVFLAQSPLSTLAGFALLFLIPRENVASSGNVRQQLARIDYAGVASLTTSLVLFLYSLASTTIQVVPLVISAFTLALFVLVEATLASDPIIPVTVLRSRGALFGAMASAGLMMCRWMVLFYSPQFAIAVRGWQPSLAGTMLIPANAGFAVGGLVVGWLHIRGAGSYYLSCVSVFSLFTATLFLLSRASTTTTPISVFILLIFANGLCTGAALNYTLVHILHLTPPFTHFIMTSLMTTFRGFGASFGSAIGGGIFARALTQSFLDLRESCGLPPDQQLLAKLLGSPIIVGTLKGVDKEIAIASYVQGVTSLFTAGTAIALAAVILQAGTGWSAPEKEAEEERESHI